MDEYYFYRKSDQTKEPIGKAKFANAYAALTYFMSKKNLNADQFASLFELGKKK
ncbi:hypothetical protein OAA15_00585 [bacterium]|nr:hypothetical protein [bacterium]